MRPGRFSLLVAGWLAGGWVLSTAEAQIHCSATLEGSNAVRIRWTTEAGKFYRLMSSGDPGGSWVVYPTTPDVMTGTGGLMEYGVGLTPGGLFFRVMRLAEEPTNPDPARLAYVAAGSFQMGDSFGEGDARELPVHEVYVSGLFVDKHEVTKAFWDEVFQWATNHNYDFNHAGRGKGPSHPVQTVDWYDVVKWCNARSEREGRVPAYYTSAGQTKVYRTGSMDLKNDWVKWNAGYRLPTEAEWERAARGGAVGRRFPWADADTISHSRANYPSAAGVSYDVSPTRGYHPVFNTGGEDYSDYPYTSPVGYFAPNGYGLYDMAGNVWEWCWDWIDWEGPYYSASPANNPQGPLTGRQRVRRGGAWSYSASHCRNAQRGAQYPDGDHTGLGNTHLGFRAVLPAEQVP